MRVLGTIALAGLLLFTAGPERLSAAETLEPMVESVTGITRTVDATLQARAAVRAVQIQTDFSHCCLKYGEGEIIAWNAYYADPIGQLIQGWLGSPSHKAMMFNPVYDRIGCATSYLAPRTYGVCLFVDTETRDGESPPAPAPAPAPSSSPSPPLSPSRPAGQPATPFVVVIPDTAMAPPTPSEPPRLARDPERAWSLAGS